MLDIKFVVDNIDATKQGMLDRNASVDVDGIVGLYSQLNKQLKEVEELKANSNKLSGQIAKLKKDGKDSNALMAQVSSDKEKIKSLDKSVAELGASLKHSLAMTPNVPHESVPKGASDSDNVVVRSVGQVGQFDFEPKPHWELGASLDIIDQPTAASITGSRFSVMKNLGARLERSIINFFLDTHTKHGYTEIFVPFMVNSDSMFGTGQLPKFEDDMFRVADTDYFLIPTAEVPLTNMFKGQIMDTLPLSFCGYSACFRKEGGSAGRDTRGLIRQHQFNKVELVKFTSPQTSYQELENLTNDAERVLQLLELPYRVVSLCSGDLGFCSAKTYDIEVWMPSYNRFVEISSCSCFESYQARRANIRCRDANGKSQYAHTLNGSGVAIGRTVAAIIENYQQKDGSIVVPKVLVDYMGTNVIK